jgi:hypothetical protein
LEQADKLLAKTKKGLPATAKSAWENERAANLWTSGKRGDAADVWNSLPESPPVQFNRGLAALFHGDKSVAQSCFSNAVEQITESSGWHHLGRLYLALAQD